MRIPLGDDDRGLRPLLRGRPGGRRARRRRQRRGRRHGPSRAFGEGRPRRLPRLGERRVRGRVQRRSRGPLRAGRMAGLRQPRRRAGARAGRARRYARCRPRVRSGCARRESAQPRRAVRPLAASPSDESWPRRSWAHGHTRSSPLGDKPVRVDQVSGALLLVRRRDFARLNGFDARFELYYEDVDLCSRAAALGGCVFVPVRWGRHVGGASAAAAAGPAYVAGRLSRMRYLRKHAPGRVTGAALLAMAGLEVVARTVARGSEGGRGPSSGAPSAGAGVAASRLRTGVDAPGHRLPRMRRIGRR